MKQHETTRTKQALGLFRWDSTVNDFGASVEVRRPPARLVVPVGSARDCR